METDRTRRAVVEAATRLLVKNRGVSLAEVAAAAGVGRTTLHRHFPGREDLVRAVALDALDRAERALDGEPGDGDVAAALGRAAEALTPIGPQLAFLLSEASLGRDPDVRRRTDEAIAPLLALATRAGDEGLLRRDVPRDWVVDAFFGLLLAAWDSVADGRLAARAAPRLVVDTLLTGVRPPHAGG